MRIGAVWEPCPNAIYRAIDPLKAMGRRGHEVVWPRDDQGVPELDRLAGCDVVHVYRRASEDTHRVVAELARQGAAITYDNDDDFTALPKDSPTYKELGGLRAERFQALSVKMAKRAQRVTMTSDLLVERYRRAGVDGIEVIGNYLSTDLDRPRERHDGVVIGWVAQSEHRVDLERLGIGYALRHLLDTHPDVRVESIGLDLVLGEGYRHERWVLFPELPRRMGCWDIGIAPLADIPWNAARSDIKVKEYAASGLAWLASPVGPYQALGEDQGGRLVDDGGWFEALDRLVTKGRERRKLARKAAKWAKGQTIEAAADRWEGVFAEAAAAR